MKISKNIAARILLTFLALILTFSIQTSAKADTNTIEFTDFLGLIIFDAEINGHKGNFLLDTGADSTIVDTRFAKRVGLKRITGILGVLSFGSVSEYDVDRLVLGEWYFSDVRLIGMDLSIVDRYLGIELMGILGGDILQDYVLSIDYQNSTFTLSDESPVVQTNSVSVPIQLREKLVFTKAKSGTDDKPRTFLVDTGATSTVYFKNRISESNPDYQSWPASKGWLEVSFAGTKEVDIHIMPSFWVGDMGIESMVTIVSDPGILGFGINLIAGSPTHGIIGWTFLRNFKVTFDYPNRQLIFEPYEYYIEKWPNLFDTVGVMIAFEDGMQPYVEHIIPDTPADRSNVNIGDKLIKVDDINVTRMNGLEISELVMGKPGTAVDFVFERNGATYSVTLHREHLFRH